MRIVCVAMLVAGMSIWSAVAQDSAASTPEPIVAALKELSARLADDPHRGELRQALGRSLREQIAAANRRSSDKWKQIESREDWERFRDEKLKALRASLGSMPQRPAKPRVMATGNLKGDGFRIHNLVYESRPGLVVTANLYVPDPRRSSMPGILLSHSHHNPKHEGELQDMGMTWARAGCYVLVPDHLGHGERRQHPFASAADFDGQFQVGRQDYYFRYDASLQLYLVGESLMGWMVHDLMTGVDVLLSQPGIDESRIILLGSVAGGGDPAGVTAALDKRIACVVPFNFGGPQPENRYPLPDDALASFNYAGGGSWESTRNLAGSAADGFLPWVIVGSVAPRKLVHAHEFSWDRERDPVWKRYRRIWDFYGAEENLAFTHGFGTIQNTSSPASHCNNIGAVHRKLIHEAFRKWFTIDVQPQDEYKGRRTRDKLTCLNDEAREAFQPRKLHEILAALADEQLAAVRQAREKLVPDQRRKLAREGWTRLVGDTTPQEQIQVREDSRRVERMGPLTVTRELVETDRGVAVPVLTLTLANPREGAQEKRPVVLGVASDGIAPALERQRTNLATALNLGITVVLTEVRGTGAGNAETDRGQQSAATSHSATALMLGQPILGGQLRDLRTVWRHIKPDFRGREAVVIGGSGAKPLPHDAPFFHPRRVARPPESRPTGALLALLLALYEDDIASVNCRRGLAHFRSVLDTPFVQVPHEAIVPGMLREGDVSDLVSALAPLKVEQTELVDGLGRLSPAK